LSPFRIIVLMPEPDCFLRYRISAVTWPYWPLQRRVVLQWFYSLSRRNTFVGGTCAPPSAFLVCYILYFNFLES